MSRLLQMDRNSLGLGSSLWVWSVLGSSTITPMFELRNNKEPKLLRPQRVEAPVVQRAEASMSPGLGSFLPKPNSIWDRLYQMNLDGLNDSHDNAPEVLQRKLLLPWQFHIWLLPYAFHVWALETSSSEKALYWTECWPVPDLVPAYCSI